LRRPVAAPSPVLRLVANTPIRSGFAASVAVTFEAAVAASR